MHVVRLSPHIKVSDGSKFPKRGPDCGSVLRRFRQSEKQAGRARDPAKPVQGKKSKSPRQRNYSTAQEPRGQRAPPSPRAPRDPRRGSGCAIRLQSLSIVHDSEQLMNASGSNYGFVLRPGLGSARRQPVAGQTYFTQRAKKRLVASLTPLVCPCSTEVRASVSDSTVSQGSLDLASGNSGSIQTEGRV